MNNLININQDILAVCINFVLINLFYQNKNKNNLKIIIITI